MLLFFLKKYSFALVETWGPHDFKMTTWKYCTSIVHELRLRMHAIFKWVNVLWSVSKGALVRINTRSEWWQGGDVIETSSS